MNKYFTYSIKDAESKSGVNNILCDVDGVLMECYAVINKVLIKEFNLSQDFRIQAKVKSWGMLELPEPIRNRALELMGNPEIVETYYFRPGSKKFVKTIYEIAKANGGELVFNTHCFNQAVADVRAKQLTTLAAELGISPKYNISVGAKKINANGKVIIDDYDGNLRNSEAPIKVHYGMFHNRGISVGFKSRNYVDIAKYLESVCA